MSRVRFGVLIALLFVACSSALLAKPSPAQALGLPCQTPGVIFDDLAGKTQLLTMNCVTDTAILVHDGYTFDGNGYTISAVEPAVGHFTGAVVQNEVAPSTIHVTNLTIDVQLPGNPCDAGEARLRGILFFGASGTAMNDVVFRLGQPGTFGCQEGNGIEARNFTDESMSDPDRTHVTISDNRVTKYQKTGILVNGNVDAIVGRNVVQGVGPTDVIAQNGIQIGFGATALVSANTISDNDYTPPSTFSCGIIVVEADGVDRKQQDNLFTDNEKDTCGYSKGGNYEPFGR
jgi:Right handed beta helix region